MIRARTVRRTPDFRVTVGGQNISSNVTDLQVGKALASPAGTWTVSTSRKVDYRAFPPNTQVKIELLGERSDGFATACLGLTDRVGDSFKISPQGKPSGAYCLQGRDLGKLLVTHAIAFDPLIAQNLDANITAQGMGIKISGTAQEVVQSLYKVGFVEKSFAREMMRFGTAQALDNLLGGQLGRNLIQSGGGAGGLLGNVTGPDIQALISSSPRNRSLTGSFQDLTGNITTDFQPTGEGFKDDFSVLGESGSMWSVLLRNADCPWNELYTVTEADGRYVLRLRPTPFGSEGRLNSDIPVHEVQPGEILEEDLGVSDHERVNFIAVLPVKNLIDTSTLRLSAGSWEFDEGSVMRNGFSNMVVSTPFVARGDISSQVEARTTQLWQWFGRNHTYRTGTIQIGGRPDIVVGEGLRYDGYEYYVEAAAQRFVFPHSYRTTLRLTRGQSIA